jgi:hypothetical protein
MNKKKKILLSGFAFVTIAAVFIAAVWWINTTKINYSHAIYAYDVHDPEKTSYGADYIFVGVVEEELETIWIHDFNWPNTKYSVTNIQNIKGNLKLNEKIEIVKDGGKEKANPKYIALMDGDILPEIGKTYIFLGKAPIEGNDIQEIFIDTPTSCIPITTADIKAKSSAKDITQTKEYQKYFEAYKNEKNPHDNDEMRGKRRPSIYEDVKQFDALGKQAKVK